MTDPTDLLHPWLTDGATVAVITRSQSRSVSTWRVKKRAAKSVLLVRETPGRPPRELRVPLNGLEKREGGAWGSTSQVVPWDDPEAVKLRTQQRRTAVASAVIEALGPLASRHRAKPITDDEWGSAVANAVEALTATLPKPPKPPEVEVHVTPGAEPNADAGEEGVVHLVCPHMECRAVDRIVSVEDAGEVDLPMQTAYFVPGDDGMPMVVDFDSQLDKAPDVEWQDKYACGACHQPVSMPEHEVSYNGAGI